MFTGKKFLNQYITKKFTLEKGLHRNNTKEKTLEIDNEYSLQDYHLLVKPLYTKPSLSYNNKWEVDVRLNLAQDDYELLEYIKHIKKHLYTNAREESGILKDYPLVSQNIRITKRDLRLKLADSLFIYDALKMNMSQKSIMEELDSYKKLRQALDDLEKLVVKNSPLYFDILRGICKGNDVSISAFIKSKKNNTSIDDDRYNALLLNISYFFCDGCNCELLKEKYSVEFTNEDKKLLKKLCDASEKYVNSGAYSHSTYRNYKKFIIEMIDHFKFLKLYSDKECGPVANEFK